MSEQPKTEPKTEAQPTEAPRTAREVCAEVVDAAKAFWCGLGLEYLTAKSRPADVRRIGNALLALERLLAAPQGAGERLAEAVQEYCEARGGYIPLDALRSALDAYRASPDSLDPAPATLRARRGKEVRLDSLEMGSLCEINRSAYLIDDRAPMPEGEHSVRTIAIPSTVRSWRLGNTMVRPLTLVVEDEPSDGGRLDAAREKIAALEKERDGARAKLAEVERERDRTRREADLTGKKIEAAIAERDRAARERDAAIIERETLRQTLANQPPRRQLPYPDIHVAASPEMVDEVLAATPPPAGKPPAIGPFRLASVGGAVSDRARLIYEANVRVWAAIPRAHGYSVAEQIHEAAEILRAAEAEAKKGGDHASV